MFRDVIGNLHFEEHLLLERHLLKNVANLVDSFSDLKLTKVCSEVSCLYLREVEDICDLVVQQFLRLMICIQDLHCKPIFFEYVSQDSVVKLED